eukprot:scaffold276_cov548-Prasinococcus_capsulatus_cf.AAC.6
MPQSMFTSTLRMTSATSNTNRARAVTVRAESRAVPSIAFPCRTPAVRPASRWVVLGTGAVGGVHGMLRTASLLHGPPQRGRSGPVEDDP